MVRGKKTEPHIVSRAIKLRHEGRAIAEIARLLGLNRITVRRILKSDQLMFSRSDVDDSTS